MGITRRTLLKAFGLGAAGLFVPTKTFFLPPAGGWGVGNLDETLFWRSLDAFAEEAQVNWIGRDIARFINEEVENYDRFLAAVRSEAPTPAPLRPFTLPISFVA